MPNKAEQGGSPRWDWIKQHVLGLGLGALCAVYGVYGLLTRSAFLPGLRGGQSTLEGHSGIDLALGYLTGGMYLVLRFYLHRRCRSESTRAQVYVIENALLLAFIGALVYLLLNVGSVGD